MDFIRQNWTYEDYASLVLHLKSLADEKYRVFSQKLILNTDNIIGVRIPLVKSLAKQIVKGNWEQYLLVCRSDTHEEIMLEGLVIGLCQASVDKVLHFTEKFIPKINNWAVCDSFCSSFKIAVSHKKQAFEFIVPYTYSKNEFEVRLGVVLLLEIFIDQEYIFLNFLKYLII
jgi:3-methyladenine DNA glycosylase AlkD